MSDHDRAILKAIHGELLDAGFALDNVGENNTELEAVKALIAERDLALVKVELLEGEVKAAETRSGMDNVIAQMQAQIDAERKAGDLARRELEGIKGRAADRTALWNTLTFALADRVSEESDKTMRQVIAISAYILGPSEPSEKPAPVRDVLAMEYRREVEAARAAIVNLRAQLDAKVDYEAGEALAGQQSLTDRKGRAVSVRAIIDAALGRKA